MFKNPTVFILGAGASWHYGYPTGEELVKMVIERAEAAADYFSTLLQAVISEEQFPLYLFSRGERITNAVRERTKIARDDARQLASRLRQVNPLVIDYFLGQNPGLQAMGTMIIAWVILECEALYNSTRANINREKMLKGTSSGANSTFKDDWYRFLIHKITINCADSAALMNNNVQFVTFNYDISLERAIYKGLHNIEMFKSSDIDSFLNAERVLHIYGKVRDDFSSDPCGLPWREPYVVPRFAFKNHTDFKHILDAAYLASKRLRVIDPHNKEADGAVIEAARDAIRRAKCVYILGYGFDDNNSKRLDLRESLRLDRQHDKCVMFTNFNGINRIRKAVSRIVYGHPGATFEAPIGQPINNHYFEMSTRDTYEALELDFDTLEDQLIAGSSI